MLSKCVFLRGRTGSGKSTVANYLKQEYPNHVEVFEFTKPVRMAICNLAGLPYNKDWFNKIKDIRSRLFYGHTPRELLIKLTEEFTKPKFGDRFLGELVLREICENGLDQDKILVFEDNRFIQEQIPLVHYFGIKNCIQLNLTYPGKGKNQENDIGNFNILLGMEFGTFTADSADELIKACCIYLNTTAFLPELV